MKKRIHINVYEINALIPMSHYSLKTTSFFEQFIKIYKNHNNLRLFHTNSVISFRNGYNTIKINQKGVDFNVVRI